ncbi:nitroreductase family deazaflavin-dependent oxidoreductase [Nocardia thailandica]|uniref:nitroreductase family deazaflavin-dependent oxidoreductase n=1 Tax=Nocardia thailandica TaxID=257275 RepID=UPI00031A5174|nr:nitroreductase family deazaflavin-dependent oxidoreductase [Nocardia thailandica]
MTEHKTRDTSALSLWFQRKMNARATAKLRRKGSGKIMGMDVAILHTVGKRSGQPRQTPVSWWPDEDGARLVIASGGGNLDPDWYVNLMANPEQASLELPGAETVGVAPRRLTGADRERAYARITAAQPRIAKYQSKSDREYPVVRLSPR